MWFRETPETAEMLRQEQGILLWREEGMCPNCLTPWKCNGPHEAPDGA